MQINLIYEASVNGAPAAFQAALNLAAQYLDNLILNPITVNIVVGYGDVNGTPLPAGILGETDETGGTLFTYSQLVNALTVNATSANDLTSVASLPSTDPTNGGMYYVAPAQLKAWGLMAPDGTEIDGYVGFSNAVEFDYNVTNGISPEQYDFIGIALHELTHAMGRITGLQVVAPEEFTALDLFRFSSPGVHDLVFGQPAYFSINNGQTALEQFEPTATDGDWLSTGPPDAFNSAIPSGVEAPMSTADIIEMNAIGFATTPDISSIYEAVLQRPASAEEYEAWYNAELAGQITESELVNDIVTSQEAVTYVYPVVRLYQAAFARVPDQAGLTGWVDAFESGALTELQIAQGFVNSAEFLLHYGTNQVSTGFVGSLYENVLGRQGSSNEISAWVNSGESANQILIGFSDSQEFQNDSRAAIIGFLDAAANGTESYHGPLLSY